MKKGIRIIAQCYDLDTGETLEESTLRDDPLKKAEQLREFGYFMSSKLSSCRKFRILKSNIKLC